MVVFTDSSSLIFFVVPILDKILKPNFSNSFLLCDLKKCLIFSLTFSFLTNLIHRGDITLFLSSIISIWSPLLSLVFKGTSIPLTLAPAHLSPISV